MRSLLGRNLRTLRLAQGLTQQALANKAGLSRATIASLERGRYPAAETSTVAALAAALNVDPSALISIHPVANPELDAFLISPWAKAVRARPEELQWLKSLPFAIWHGVEVDAQTLAELLAWRRRHER
jgi:transcriptional regulator with XRE-family HTH domain